MSVYSGFAKRSYETTYNRLIFKVLEILSGFVLNSRLHKPNDEHLFQKKVVKAY